MLDEGAEKSDAPQSWDEGGERQGREQDPHETCSGCPEPICSSMRGAEDKHWDDLSRLLNLLLCLRHIPACHTGEDIFSGQQWRTWYGFFYCSLWDQDPPFQDLCPAALAKFGTETLKVLTSNKLHESKAAGGGEQPPGEKDHGSFRSKACQKAGLGPGHCHPKRRCVCVRLGWLAPSGILQTCHMEQGMCPHPRCVVPGDAGRDVHKDCPRCLVGWQRDTYVLLSEWPDVFPTPFWQVRGFPVAWCPRQSLPREPKDSRHSDF